MSETFKCFLCGRVLPVKKEGGTGYASLPHNEGAKYCYDCCAERDAHEMTVSDRIVLYLSEPFKDHGGCNAVITNWPGTLRFVGAGHKSDHNMAGKNGRTDVWFDGPDGKRWHGVNIGDNQILRCRKLKRQHKDLTPLKKEEYIKPYKY